MKKLLIASTALTLISAPAMAYTATTAELDEMTIQELNRYQLQQLKSFDTETPILVSANDDVEPRTYTTIEEKTVETNTSTYMSGETEIDSFSGEVMTKTSNEVEISEPSNDVPMDTMTEEPDEMTYTPVGTDDYSETSETVTIEETVETEVVVEKASTEKGEYDETKTPYIKSIASIDQADTRFTTLVAALKHADLYETMEGEGPFTVFAPTNEAFEKIDPEVREYLMSDAGKEDLASILKAHVVSGKLTKADLKASTGNVETISDFSAAFEKNAEGNYTVENAQIVKTDVYAGNGVAHVIDTVIIPEMVLQNIETAMETSMTQ